MWGFFYFIRQKPRKGKIMETETLAPEETIGEEIPPPAEEKTELTQEEQDDQKARNRAFFKMRQEAAETKAENERLRQELEAKKPADLGEEPRAENFETDAEYYKALSSYNTKKEFADLSAKSEADRKADREKARNKEKQQEFNGKMDKGFEKYPDFEETVFNKAAHLPEKVVSICYDLDHPADVLYFLAKHPEKSFEIEAMTPFRAAAELGRIESQTKGPPPKSETKAPAPAEKLGSGDAGKVDPEKMSMKDYIQWKNKQEFGE